MIKCKCGECGKIIVGYGLITSPVEYEGCSEISISRDNVYDVDDNNFCDIECFILNIRKGLGLCPEHLEIDHIN